MMGNVLIFSLASSRPGGKWSSERAKTINVKSEHRLFSYCRIRGEVMYFRASNESSARSVDIGHQSSPT
ncbi:hypothetical protein BGW80DRAFT_1378892, partial [Lactifluus volemus]